LIAQLPARLTQALSFLHSNRIAHLVCSTSSDFNVHCLFIVHQDIAYENILINHHGKIPSGVVWTSCYEPPTKIIPPPEFRSTFPIRYFLIDFGVAHYFSKHLRLEECFIEPFLNGREQQPPEASWNKRYNPFAADVYQVARLFYGWFAVSDLPLIYQDQEYK
jgi:serine/threonine protein kinase